VVSALTRLPGRARVALCLLGVLGVGTVTAVVIGVGGSNAAPPRYAVVAEGAVTSTAGAAGNVQSADSRDLAFSASGMVKKVYVKVGRHVKEGTKLAQIDQTKANEDVAAAKAAVAAAEAALDGTNTGTTATGTAFTGGARIVPVAYAPTTAPPSSTSSSPAPSSTPSSRPSSRPTATRRPSTGPSAPRNPTTSRSAGASRSPGTSGGTMSTAQLEAKVIQAKNNLAQAERTLAGTVITAPIDGTVLAVNGQTGDMASANSTFITIGDLNELQLQATFSQNDMAHVRIGQDAKITLSADPTKTYAGSVTHIDSNGTSSGQLVKYGVMIAFDDMPSKVLIGQSGTVSVTTGSATDVLYVPSSAVRSGANGKSTVRVRQGNQTVGRTVTVGLRGDAYLEIKSGLTKGEQVVTSG
jgi:HlyD family secretion protein